VRERLVQLAKEYRFHGARVLRLAQVPGCTAALLAAVQGIISKGLVEEPGRPAGGVRKARSARGQDRRSP